MLSVKSRKNLQCHRDLKTCLWLWSAWTWACVITEKGIFWVWQTKYIMFLAVWYKQHHVRHNEEKRFVPMLDQNAPCSWPQKRLMNLLHQITWWWSALCFFKLKTWSIWNNNVMSFWTLWPFFIYSFLSKMKIQNS